MSNLFCYPQQEWQADGEIPWLYFEGSKAG